MGKNDNERRTSNKVTFSYISKRQALRFLFYLIQILRYLFTLHDIHYITMITGISYLHYMHYSWFLVNKTNLNLRCSWCSGKLTFLNNNLFSPLQMVFNANTCLALTVKAKILKLLQIRFRNIACGNWINPLCCFHTSLPLDALSIAWRHLHAVL